MIRPSGMDRKDVKLAASVGLVLASGSWSELFLGALAGGAPGRRVRAGAVGKAWPEVERRSRWLVASA